MQVSSQLRAESSTDDTNAPRPPTIIVRGRPAALGLAVRDLRGWNFGGRGGNNLKHLYQEIWKEMLLGTDICFGFVKFVKYNYKSMLEKTAAKNALQREESKLIWRPKIKTGIPIFPPGNWKALGIGQSLSFPLFPLKDIKPGLFRLNHSPFHKFEAVPTCCPEG